MLIAIIIFTTRQIVLLMAESGVLFERTLSVIMELRTKLSSLGPQAEEEEEGEEGRKVSVI